MHVEIISAKSLRPRKPSAWIEGDTVNFAGQHDYKIEMSDIKTHRDLLAWICHLSEKSWSSTKMIRQFAIEVAKRNGWNLYGL